MAALGLGALLGGAVSGITGAVAAGEQRKANQQAAEQQNQLSRELAKMAAERADKAAGQFGGIAEGTERGSLDDLEKQLKDAKNQERIASSLIPVLRGRAPGTHLATAQETAREKAQAVKDIQAKIDAEKSRVAQINAKPEASPLGRARLRTERNIVDTQRAGKEAVADVVESRNRTMNQLMLGREAAADIGKQTIGDIQQTLSQRPGRADALLQDPSAILNDPSFLFRQQQGEQAINRAAAARGGRLSGRTLQELSGFNQGLASNELQNAFQRANVLDQQDLGVQSQIAAQQGQIGSQLLGGNLATFGQSAGAQQAIGSQLAGIRAGTAANVANLGEGGSSRNLNTLLQLAQGRANAINQGTGQIMSATQPQFGAAQLNAQGAGGVAQAIGGATNNALQNLLFLQAYGQK